MTLPTSARRAGQGDSHGALLNRFVPSNDRLANIWKGLFPMMPKPPEMSAIQGRPLGADFLVAAPEQL
jgi:hypothetical protein